MKYPLPKLKHLLLLPCLNNSYPVFKSLEAKQQDKESGLVLERLEPMLISGGQIPALVYSNGNSTECLALQTNMCLKTLKVDVVTEMSCLLQNVEKTTLICGTEMMVKVYRDGP